MAYKESAITAFNNRMTQEQQAAEAERTAFDTAARQTAAPLFKDSAGTLVIPQTQIKTLKNDIQNRVVIIQVQDGSSVTADGSPITFAVYPDQKKSRLIKKVDGEWTEGPWVEDLDDVGEVLAGGEW